MGLFSSRSELISRPICYRTILPRSRRAKETDAAKTRTRVYTSQTRSRERGRGGGVRERRPSVSATVEKDARKGGRTPIGAESGDRGCTLTHRHKINTFFSLHRRPGDNHEIMWLARASERHRNVWLPLRSVITHPRRAKPSPSVATCCVSLHRRQLSGTSTLAISLQVYRIDRREVVANYADSLRGR